MNEYFGHWILEGRTPVKEPNLIKWARWLESNHRDVRKTVIFWFGRQILVSTVFLGVDHNWGRGEAPILFETMIFNHRGLGSLYDYQERYATYEEALVGHRRAIRFAWKQLLFNAFVRPFLFWRLE